MSVLTLYSTWGCHLCEQAEALVQQAGLADKLQVRDIVDDEALLAALNNGQLQAACLDVFRQEPLPAQHPFWQHPAILITPHVSAVTNVSTVVAQIADNYRRSQRGELMANLVDISKGY